jgi:chromosome partitioning protein
MEQPDMNRRKNSSGARYMLTTAELGKLFGLPAGEIEKSLDGDVLVHLPGGSTGVPPVSVRKFFESGGFKYKFTKLAHVNLKGGIGKTTTAITTATRAAQFGFKTCILDMDSQGSASMAFNKLPDENDLIFRDVWQNPSKMVMDAVKEIEDGLWILPSSLENSLLDLSLSNPASQKNAVKNVCETLRESGFDLVIIDCPPSLNAAVISSICAADVVIIPVCSDAFSMRGLEITMEEIGSICEAFNMEQPRIRVLYTKYDRRMQISRDTMDVLSKKYKKFLAPVTIRTSSHFSKALSQKETVFASHRKSIARDDYDRYTRYLLGVQYTEDGSVNHDG